MGRRKRVDDDGDEWTGPPSGAVHECMACGKRDVWSPGWAWYGSYADSEHGRPIFKACSDECMARREDVMRERAADLEIAEAERLLKAAEERVAMLRTRLTRARASHDPQA